MIATSKTEEIKLKLLSFLNEHGLRLTPSKDFQAMGRVSSSGTLLGAVGYDNFCGRTCVMHMAGEPGWINRDLLWAAFDYPFNQLNLAQVFGSVAGNDSKALNLDRKLGFRTLEVISEGWVVGVDLHILTMSKKDCKWLEIKHELKAA